MQTHMWEQRLLSLAHEAHHHGVLEHGEHKHASNKVLLEQAYCQCGVMTARHSKSFHLASALLPPDKRRAARALYAFCRTSDDLVDDRTVADNELALERWRRRVAMTHPAANDLVAIAWLDTRHRFKIPHRYAEQLIDGVARDLVQTRYETFADLTTYAYGVASTVGLMSMHIIGFAGHEAIPYAIKLGVALQLTNILRDVGEDWSLGRVYLPTAELEAFNLAEADLAGGQVDRRWREFMRFQIERNRRLYAEAWPGIALLDPDGRLAIAAAARLYEAILADIEAADYNVFTRRGYVTTWSKLRMLPGLWLESKRVKIKQTIY
jgi:phytoene synthase